MYCLLEYKTFLAVKKPVICWISKQSLVELCERITGFFTARRTASLIKCVMAHARNRGLQQFTVRGFSMSKITLLWFALAHNLMREAALRPVAA